MLRGQKRRARARAPAVAAAAAARRTEGAVLVSNIVCVYGECGELMPGRERDLEERDLEEKWGSREVRSRGVRGSDRLSECSLCI